MPAIARITFFSGALEDRLSDRPDNPIRDDTWSTLAIRIAVVTLALLAIDLGAVAFPRSSTGGQRYSGNKRRSNQAQKRSSS